MTKFLFPTGGPSSGPPKRLYSTLIDPTPSPRPSVTNVIPWSNPMPSVKGLSRRARGATGLPSGGNPGRASLGHPTWPGSPPVAGQEGTEVVVGSVGKGTTNRLNTVQIV